MTGRSGWRSLMMRQQLQAALAGQGQVQQQQVEAILIEGAQSLFAIDGHGDRVAFQREQHFQATRGWPTRHR